VTGVVGSGALLGILSRLDERTPGLSAGVSSDAMWVAVAFAIGSSRQSARGGAAGGAVTLTAANLGYYGWILATEFTDPAAVAGAPSLWLILGLAGGALFGAAGAIGGRAHRWSEPPRRCFARRSSSPTAAPPCAAHPPATQSPSSPL
jgi:hypothetical protein